ncbi:hypothetical protein GCK72_011111 [Caenorhabditis remanei]|uniref:Uncharacterized protein n=1 Tax=Caenorhabditis remanei TaxID=31234 RepID=A0A6A5H543_CAERE|nr:hypothetical protein GCK72_011111 [Caenorhabditis remanei]KAF1762848.1 hypothetical protein GCK72_011111 [Caenorhabditis remanei]
MSFWNCDDDVLLDEEEKVYEEEEYPENGEGDDFMQDDMQEGGGNGEDDEGDDFENEKDENEIEEMDQRNEDDYGENNDANEDDGEENGMEEDQYEEKVEEVEGPVNENGFEDYDQDIGDEIDPVTTTSTPVLQFTLPKDKLNRSPLCCYLLPPYLPLQPTPHFPSVPGPISLQSEKVAKKEAFDVATVAEADDVGASEDVVGGGGSVTSSSSSSSISTPSGMLFGGLSVEMPP